MSDEPASDFPRFTVRHRMELAMEWRGIGREDMAAHLDLSLNTIGNYLAGRTQPSRSTLRDWAMRCGVPFDWLVTGREPGGDPEPSVTRWYDTAA